jgi:hypothetical protein
VTSLIGLALTLDEIEALTNSLEYAHVAGGEDFLDEHAFAELHDKLLAAAESTEPPATSG